MNGNPATSNTLELPIRPAVQSRTQTQARIMFTASVLITGVLWAVPYGDVIGLPLMWFATLVHELGHGVAALLVGGEFRHLKIFVNGSGVAQVAHSGGINGAIVAAGGLVGPAIAAGIGFALGRSAVMTKIVTLIGSVFLIVASALWIRSWLGWVVAILIATAGLAIAALPENPRWSQLWVLFLSVQLALSAFSSRDYLFTNIARTTAGTFPSDSAQIAAELIGPYWLWGGICGLVSNLALVIGAWVFVRPVGSPRGN